MTDEQILAGLRRRTYDRIARKAARRIEELLSAQGKKATTH
ncbi:hypothetical protein [Litchfieldella rifensis]|uniref:Uncharacterized protein n=1 Tax=Litchfieldella rifensis TaxID=762643 RepID=A0ABV7LIY7_9GAMM